jgi:2-methylisocitrate lyase-like PEP mutase family enzyme
MAAFARAGAGAVMFEDRIRAERIGQRADVVPQAEMVGRLRAAVDASAEAAVVARCDALAAGRPMSEAIDRGAAYAEAGAELLFFAGLRFEDIPKVAAGIAR